MVDCPLEPFCEENAGGQPMRDDDKINVRGIVTIEPIHVYVPPQRLHKTCGKKPDV